MLDPHPKQLFRQRGREREKKPTSNDKKGFMYPEWKTDSVPSMSWCGVFFIDQKNTEWDRAHAMNNEKEPYSGNRHERNYDFGVY